MIVTTMKFCVNFNSNWNLKILFRVYVRRRKLRKYSINLTNDVFVIFHKHFCETWMTIAIHKLKFYLLGFQYVLMISTQSKWSKWSNWDALLLSFLTSSFSRLLQTLLPYISVQWSGKGSEIERAVTKKQLLQHWWRDFWTHCS